jgi:hypothetical protein
MDALAEFLDAAKQIEPVRGNFLGLLHVLIGRRIQKADGTVISQGVTWRTLAGALRSARWERDAVRELGLDPAKLPPRDRERFWYTAIGQVGVDSQTAVAAGDRLASALRPLGYIIGPAPGRSPDRPA